MARTRIISANKALFTSATGLLAPFYGGVAGEGSGIGPAQIHRVDDLSFSVDVAGARTDVREFGQLARITTLRTTELLAELSFGYFLTNGENERHLGLNVDGIVANAASSSFISGALADDPKKSKRNIYILTVKEGDDAFDSTVFNTNSSEHDVVAFGDAGITNYSMSLAVGEIPRAEVTFEAGNIQFFASGHSGFKNPTIAANGGPGDTGKWALFPPSTGDTIVDVLKPADITVSFSSNTLDMGGVDLSDICIQSASIDIPLSRTPIECLGRDGSEARPLDTPITATCSISSLVKDFQTGSLQNILVNSIQGTPRDITLNLKDRKTKTSQIICKLVDAVLDNQSFSQGIDDNQSVDLTFSAQLGGATTTTQGLFFSGSYTTDNVTNPTSANNGLIANIGT